MSEVKEMLKAAVLATPPRDGIAGKLVAAMDEIDAVTKEGANETQHYKYVKASDVAKEVRGVLVKHRIAFTYSVLRKDRWQTDRFNRDGAQVGFMNYVDIDVAFTFIDADTGEKVTVEAPGSGQDTGEKAVYKAMTGALKYALRMNFIIPDESDPENDSHEKNGDYKESAEKRAAEARTQLAESQGEFSVNGDVLTCVIKGIQQKETTGNKKTPYLIATFNGRLPNGANFASCFDKELWESLNYALDKKCRIKVQMKEKFANITDVEWVEGLGGPEEPAAA